MLGCPKQPNLRSYNPVKRCYVDEPVHWRYSSARNYVGDQGMLEITRN
ncbi:MAG: hypothetical protein RL368_2024 [Pseudomonadota bacterium]|jgi:hypothetical protein